jgi:hypothetical protein
MKAMKNLLNVLCLLGSMTAASHADQTVTDGFEKSKTNEPLAGQEVESGQASWEATENLQAIKKGGQSALSVSNSEGFVARVPVAETFSSVTVEAEVLATAAGGGDPWIAIGLGGGSINPGSVNVNWARGIFLLVSAKGRYQCILNPSGANNIVQILGGEIDRFSAGDAVPVKLEYNKDENKVNMWVNGRLVLKNHDLAQNGFTPTVPYAGISGYGQKPDQFSVDNFSLSVQ